MTPAIPFRRRADTRSGRGEDGATLVETALSMVVLLAVIFGVFEMCLALYTYHFISEAAREGTRFAIVRGSACASTFGTTACPASGPDVSTYVKSLGFPGIDPGDITVITNWPTTGVTCTPSVSPCNNRGNLVQVTVQYNFPLSIPFIRKSNIAMSSSSQMVISQ